VHTGFWWGDMMVRGHLHNLGVDGTMILKWVKKYVGVERIDLAQNRDNWQAFVNTVMNLRLS
jgi:hypothetical protein